MWVNYTSVILLYNLPVLFRRVPDWRRVGAFLSHHRDVLIHFDFKILGIISGPSRCWDLYNPSIIKSGLDLSLFSAAPQMQRHAKVLRPISGIGPVLCAVLIGEMPELGDKQIAALAGVAPINNDSGRTEGKRLGWSVVFAVTAICARLGPQSDHGPGQQSKSSRVKQSNCYALSSILYLNIYSGV